MNDDDAGADEEIATPQVEFSLQQRQIDKLLVTVQCDEYSLAAAVLAIVESAPQADRPPLFRFAFEHPTKTNRDYSEGGEIVLDAVLPDEDVKALAIKYGSIVDSLLELALGGRWGVDEFYEKVMDAVDNPVFDSAESRAFALYWLWIDKRLPYFQLPEGTRMSQEDFAGLGRELTSERAKIRFIIATDHAQRSQQADLLLRVLDDHEGLQRIRLMASVVWEIRSRERQRNGSADR